MWCCLMSTGVWWRLLHPKPYTHAPDPQPLSAPPPQAHTHTMFWHCLMSMRAWWMRFKPYTLTPGPLPLTPAPT